MNLQAIDRYPGARSFYDNATDRLLFNGREEEIDLLFHRVCATRLLVLFGKSGVGKTSLLQAGIFEKLRQEQHRLPYSYASICQLRRLKLSRQPFLKLA